ncbi:MAG: DUF4760 domain-containing protein [Candidatus Eremiobacteraeota bacterium]|nr:DUF4760 domain-containing protein [Candidatus Eremiobacteraeota bacterium]
MSLELVNTLATFGTFLVIAGTAIAAIVQLRHARSSDQIEALAELREGTENPEMRLAERFVLHELSEKLKDPDFRYQIANQGAMTSETQLQWSDIRRVANFFENRGALVKGALVDKRFVLDIFSSRVLSNWGRLTPVIAIIRQSRGDSSIWENFEYLAVLSQDWEAAHPNGTYPAGVRRIDFRYPWLDADKQYAASLTPA